VQTKLIACGTVAIFGAGALANPVVIDFESLLDGQEVTNQFADLAFHGSAIAKSNAAGGSLGAGFPPYSGDTVIFDDPNSSMPGVIRVDATTGAFSAVSAYVTTFAPSGVTLRAFSASGVEIASDSTPVFGQPGFGDPNILLSVAVSGIAWVTFSDSGNEFSVDNFTYAPELPSAPLPSAAMIAGVGIGLVALRRCRT
jgi:hypothetical protein